jgi:hypothetical protein
MTEHHMPQPSHAIPEKFYSAFAQLDINTAAANLQQSTASRKATP